MNTGDLMCLSAEKAIKQLSWESIEFLFRPSNHLELFLRLDMNGCQKIFYDAITDDSPTALPWRFRPPYSKWFRQAVDRERFYQQLKKLHERNDCGRNKNVKD